MRAVSLAVTVCVGAWLATGSRAATVDRQTFETDDAVIIEGAGLEDSVRLGRQATNLLGRASSVIPPGWPGLPAGVTDTCDTRDGRAGRCMARSLCFWTRSLPDGDRSLERSLGPCLAGESGQDAAGRRRKLTRGVCCPGLFSEFSTSTSTAAPITNRASTTAAPTSTTTRPAITQWWQTTYQPNKASTTTARPTTTTAKSTTSTAKPATTSTARPRPSVPTIPPIITHPWQGSSSTTTAPTTTAWWQTTAGPTESTAATTTQRVPTTTAWWQTTASAAGSAATTTTTTTTTQSVPTTTAWWQTSVGTTTLPSTAAPAGPEAAAAVGSNEEYSRCGTSNYEGDTGQDRIVGGKDARQGEFPWIAGIFKGKRQFCGGSLIDETHILTAAHCVAHMTSYDVRRLVVRLGDHNIKRDDDADHEEFSVARIIRHKGFSDQTLHTDIALLTLSKKVTYKDNIRPICLVSDDSVRYAGENVTVAGWGSLSEAGFQPEILQKVTLKVWENSRCASSYGKSAPGGIIKSMLCAASPDKDSCSGDSGGPLVHFKGGIAYQIGVVSWGIGCAKPQYPGVYTRVTALKNWIERNREAY